MTADRDMPGAPGMPGGRGAGTSEHPVDDYIDSLPEPRREVIAALYQSARELVPEATECVKYQMPALIVDGKGLVSVMSTKKHVGIYPYSGSVVSQYADELDSLGIPTTKGAIQLPDGVRLPDELFARVIRSRRSQIG